MFRGGFSSSLAGIVLLSCSAVLLPVQAQEAGSEPVFKVSVVSKNTKAINYKVMGGATRVDLIGTAIMPGALGKAKVESKQSRIDIDANVENLEAPSKFGSEYLTYVLWSISPEGRATNLGEVLLDKGKGKLSVSTDLQVFALIVTAEPYFAVRQPSDLIVLENELRKDTKGQVFIVDTKYELLQKGQYSRLPNPLSLTVDTKTFPLELYEARNALFIAQEFGADKYAADVYSKAKGALQMADNAVQRKLTRADIATSARQAVQFAEDARELAIKRQQDEALSNERAAAAKREQEAKARADEQQRQRIQADADRQAEEARRALADKQRIEAELAATKEAARRAEAEAARLAAEAAQRQADENRAKAEQATAAAEAAKAQALAEQEKAQKLAEAAEREKAELRAKLLQQFNQILETKDSERGLVVNLGDVLFDTGKYTIRPLAREKLARLSGIVLAYPGLKLESEGHTDNVGGEQFNQKLSEQRAQTVRDYLVSQGIPDANVTSTGKGFSMPVAPNDTAAGRQKNRRVEIIVSGEVIGTKIGSR
ncbi:OmpA family protein [uncultured Paludibaculum sp.]|uniref:OmpA family protein n=1 Tax=uncultured Paludibaculum sp. TaxID=1765020 RepID=UPI002AAB076A|nr:OmpA family protein [uncultured Paludibaculum sp.]